MLNVQVFLLSVCALRSAAASVLPNITLFDYEKTQFTDNDLAELSAEQKIYFAFDDSAVNTSFTIKSGACKVLPSDDDFPPARIWKDFNTNKFVNGALISPDPLASSCYKNWGNYDEQKCAAIAANWTNPYLQ
jgi:hypothetical protein